MLWEAPALVLLRLAVPPSLPPHFAQTGQYRLGLAGGAVHFRMQGCVQGTLAPPALGLRRACFPTFACHALPLLHRVLFEFSPFWGAAPCPTPPSAASPFVSALMIPMAIERVSVTPTGTLGGAGPGPEPPSWTRPLHPNILLPPSQTLCPRRKQ